MRIIVIAAADERNGIGKDGKIPWHLPEDLKQFKKYTLNNAVVMGRKTYDSIGHALKGRINIVVSKDPNFKPTDVDFICNDPKNIPELKNILPDMDIFIIGGQKIYEAAWEYADLFYITRVEGDYDCDTFIPQVTGRLIYGKEMKGAKFEIWKRQPNQQFMRTDMFS